MARPRIGSRWHAVWCNEFFHVTDVDSEDDDDYWDAELTYDDGSVEWIGEFEWEDSVGDGDIVEVRKS